MEMLRNCSHGSEISTYLVEAPLGKKIVKTALTKGGISDLRNEFEGWKWYQERRYSQLDVPVCNIRLEKPACLSIEIKFIEGHSPDYTKGLAFCEKEVALAVKHYCSVWPKSVTGTTELHGDFALGNIIYNASGLHVIDWEHFSRNSAPWGFDPLYLLLETLWFGMHGKTFPLADEMRILAENIKLLQHSGEFLPDMLKTPVGFMSRFLNENSQLWGLQYRKFPVLRFTEGQTRAIESGLLKIL